VCVCSRLPTSKIVLPTKVMVISHPCEKKKRMIGTVPLIDLCLANYELLELPADPLDSNNHIKGCLRDFPSLQHALLDKSTVLLYPGPHAVAIEQLPSPPGAAQRTLIVVDGTWRQAAKIMREDSIQKVRFARGVFSIGL
jgi:DTW domain-containing protein YfiP